MEFLIIITFCLMGISLSSLMLGYYTKNYEITEQIKKKLDN